MLFVWLGLIVVGCIIIMKACDPFEDGASYIGRNMGTGIKGATINAIGSSMPELCTAFIFLFWYQDGATNEFASGIATTAGSAMFNALIIPGLVIFTALKMIPNLKGIKINKVVLIRDGIFFILSEVALILLLKNGILEWWMGAVLIGIYVLYAITLIVHNNISKSVEDDEEEDYDGMTTCKAWLTLLVSVIFIGIGCFVMTHSVVEIAKIFEIPTFFIAVILAAGATSVPDTIISMKDAKKGNYDDAVSNAVGSNIFDICIGLGLPLLVYTLVYNPTITVDTGVVELRILLLCATGILLTMFLVLKKLGKGVAFVLLSMYCLYAFYTLSRGFSVEWANTVGNTLFSLIN